MHFRRQPCFPLIYVCYSLGVVCWWFFLGRPHAFHVAGVFFSPGIFALVAITLPGVALLVLLFRNWCIMSGPRR